MKIHPLCGAALLLLLPLSPSARAEPRHELSAGVSLLVQMGTFRPAPGHMLGELLGLWTLADEGPWSGVQVGGGLRSGVPGAPGQLPLEGFVRTQVSTRMGYWRPAAGLELGLSGFNDRLYNTAFPDNRQEGYEDARLGPAYGAFTASPLRFQFGRLQLDALHLSLGTQLRALGSSARVQLGILSLGGTL